MHIEYQYALDKKIPVFAVILSDSYLFSKAAQEGSDNIFEKDNTDKYKNFKEYVLSKIIRIADDEKDIKLTIHTALSEFSENNKLTGWIRGDVLVKYEKLLKQHSYILKENSKLVKENDTFKTQKLNKQDDMIGDFSYYDLKNLLFDKIFKIPAFDGKNKNKEEKQSVDALKLFTLYFNLFCTGITNRLGVSDFESHFYYKVAPFYISCGLLEKVKVTWVVYERIQITNNGKKFITKYRLENLKEKNKPELKPEILSDKRAVPQATEEGIAL